LFIVFGVVGSGKKLLAFVSEESFCFFFIFLVFAAPRKFLLWKESLFSKKSIKEVEIYLKRERDWNY